MRLDLEIEAILHGTLVPTTSDWDLIAAALNERAFELGADHPVPYSTDPEPP